MNDFNSAVISDMERGSDLRRWYSASANSFLERNGSFWRNAPEATAAGTEHPGSD